MNLAHLIDDHPGDSVALFSRGRPTTYGELRRAGRLDPRRPRRPRHRSRRPCRDRVQQQPLLRRCLPRRARPRCRAVPLNPTSPAPEIAREIAAVGAKAAIVDPVAAVGLGRDRTRVPVGRTCRRHRRVGDRGSCRLRRAAVPHISADRRGRARHARGPDLHERHRRLAQGRHAHPRQPPLEHRPEPHGGRRRAVRRRRLRRAAAVPHLRVERRARSLARPRRDGRAGQPLRSGRPRSTRSASAASPWSPARRRCGSRGRQFDGSSGRLVRVGAPRAHRRGEDARGRHPPARAALRAAAERGLRAHRGVAGRDELGRAADQARFDRQGARRHRGAARRRPGRRRRQRRSRRDLGAGARTSSPATSTIPRRRRGRSRPTAGCAPATSP